MDNDSTMVVQSLNSGRMPRMRFEFSGFGDYLFLCFVLLEIVIETIGLS